ncbi:LuxR family transcriptional regulator [Sphingomonadaceae bacterium]|nr:LuxR family transcriptional regulator [Sphingomonadaceae bacterium]
MEAQFSAISTLNEIGEVLLFNRKFCLSQGCFRSSYHFTPVYENPTSVSTVVYKTGYPAEWVELYDRQEFRDSDPVPERTLRHGQAMTWQAALAMEPLTEPQQRFANAMREYGLEHGFGLPIFGPSGRHAYASFDFGIPLSEVPEEKQAIIKAVARTGHLRICELLEVSRNTPSLSERETEVLHWIASGKSNTDIGTILNISPETVRTYTQRIYDKLGTRDRTGAAITGLKLGLLHV